MNEPNTFLQAALDYANRDWAIFPCEGKLPATVEGCKNATTDAELIAETWKSTRYNIGLATGKQSGIVVLDIDADKGGIASLDNLEAEHGPLPMTVTACTGGGGYHYYFRYPATEIRNRTGIRSGIDVRGEGGYVIAPPSSHVSGDSYRWDEASAPDECELAEVPAWLLELMRREPEPSRQNLATLSSPGRSDLHQRAQQYIARAASASEGHRNAAAFSLAGNLAAFVDEAGGRLSEPEILSYVRMWNMRNAPPLEDSELQTCVKSSLTNGTPRADKTAEQRSRTSNLWLPGEATANCDTPELGIEKFTLAQLADQYPTLAPPVIDGIAREGEVVNIIAAPKVGKSWLVYGLLLAIVAGCEWFGFPTRRGRVLLIDNELHRANIAQRIKTVGDALTMFPADYRDQLDIWPLRGRLKSLPELGPDISKVEPGQYKLIVLDAKYRFNPPGTDENSNDPFLNNLLDQYAGHTRAAIAAIHHSSKGDQSNKSVTDVGAGGGVQSRAADTHLILREHEEPGVVVLDAALRSFKPVEPVALRWNFPLWHPVDADTRKLKGRLSKQEERQKQKDSEGMEQIVEVLRGGPGTARDLRNRVAMGNDRAGKLLARLLREGQIEAKEITVKGNITKEYSLPEGGL